MQHFFTDVAFGNLAYHVEDNPLHVEKNRKKLAQKIGNKKLLFMKQVHGDRIEVVDKNSVDLVCDAMISDDKDVALCVMVADCIPALLYDEKKGVIGVAHAGRSGSYKRIITKTISKMKDTFTCKDKDIKVILGPSIKKCCYEVGHEVVKGFETFTSCANSKLYLDLIALNIKDLENVEISPTCTCCDTRYFSYRREGVTGRFCGVITL